MIPFAALALITLGLSVWLLYLIIAKAPTLAAFGLTGNLFYVTYVMLGVAVAACFFGILRSTAAYRGKAFGGVLELGGPPVVCALVVLGGFMFGPNSTPFAITIFVHGPHGKQDSVLRNSGALLLDLGPNRRREKIGDKGEAYFSGIQKTFRGQEVTVGIESETYEPAHPNEQIKLDHEGLYFEVRPKSGRLKGRTQDLDGRAVSGALIEVAGLTITSGPDGRFELEIPGDLMRPELALTATALGYRQVRNTVVPNGNDIDVQFARR